MVLITFLNKFHDATSMRFRYGGHRVFRARSGLALRALHLGCMGFDLGAFTAEGLEQKAGLAKCGMQRKGYDRPA